MNKKLLRKLTLSAVTLGVAAVSATTSTFAWFTTNGTVTANTVSGTVKASDVLALIKSPTGWDASGNAKYDGSYTWNNESTTYDTSTTTSAQNFLQQTTLHSQGGDNTKLQPVAIGGTYSATNVGTFTTKANGAHTFAENTVATDYIHYQFVIALSSLDTTKTYNVKMQLPALSQAEHSQYLLANAGTNSSTAKGSTLTFKVEDALSIGIKNTIVASTNKANYGVGTLPTGTQLSNFVANSDATGNYHAIAETGANDAKGDAIAYYNNVFGLSDNSAISLPNNYTNNYGTGETKNVWYSNTSTATAKTIYSITGVSEAIIATDLYFFIDGWDYQCFNAIGGLSLFDNDAKIEFNVEKNEA